MFHLRIFLSGFATAFALVAILVSLFLHGLIEVDLPVRHTVERVDLANDKLHVKLYLKQRLGKAGYSLLLENDCLDQLVSKLQHRNAIWKSMYCYQSYSHMLYEFKDQSGNNISILKSFWRNNENFNN